MNVVASTRVAEELDLPDIAIQLNCEYEPEQFPGVDSLLSIAQMPKGIPVGALAIGEDGAINAALLAASIIANNNPIVKKKLNNLRLSQTKAVKKKPK